MPSVIEDDDPGESPIHVSEIVISSDADDVPALDIELFVDQLRFMGLDRDLVEEANRRLRADHRSGMRWLAERLKELEPPRKPPSCQCGEALVDASWRGRATVRCNSCGSRWGVEVIDEETEAYWPISGPSEEWREAHPDEEYDPYGDFQPEDVLRDGLPPRRPPASRRAPTSPSHPGSAPDTQRFCTSTDGSPMSSIYAATSTRMTSSTWSSIKRANG